MLHGTVKQLTSIMSDYVIFTAEKPKGSHDCGLLVRYGSLWVGGNVQRGHRQRMVLLTTIIRSAVVEQVLTTCSIKALLERRRILFIRLGGKSGMMVQGINSRSECYEMVKRPGEVTKKGLK